MNFETLVNIAQDGPWCGTRPPGYPRLHPSLEAAWEKLRSRPGMRRHQADIFSHDIVGPEPDPWRLGAIEVGLYGAIVLHQMGQKLSGGVAESLRLAALALFDETCGVIPHSELIWLLLHRQPPPMPPWLTSLVFTGEMLAFADATRQDVLAAVAGDQLIKQLDECGLQTQAEGDCLAA
jgi:hypothetical protein